MTTGTDLQNRVFALLADPRTHGLPEAAPVERIDTHISAVFLAGDRVYKVPRAVVFPFLDHRDVAVREAVCRREVVLNEPQAPGLYLGVVAITEGGDGALTLAGSGAPVAWAVVMRRFEQAALLSHIVNARRPARRLFTDLAERLAAFHDRAPVIRHRPDWFAETLTNTLSSLFAYRGVLGAHACEAIAADLTRTAGQAAPLLRARAAAGKVRRCHGDLHLGNIVWWDGALRPFDAIDFNDMFVEIDVLYDLAFLLMDLDEQGHRRPASYVLNHTLDFTGDLEGLALLPLFLSLRSVIRAFATAASDPAAGCEAGSEAGSRARAYLERANTYLRPPSPRVLAIGGLSGSGKSRLARKLAPMLPAALGAVTIRSDVVRKRLMGLGPFDTLPQRAYTPDLAAETYAEMRRQAASALASGTPVVLDAVFAGAEERLDAQRLAEDCGVPFAGLWTEADTDVALRRIAGRTRNPSDATADVRLKQESYDIGAMAWPVIDSSGPAKATLQSAIDILRSENFL